MSTVVNARTLKEVHQLKIREGYNYDENDIKYENNWSIIKVVLTCFLAGLLGGTIGVAGGVILAPLFLGLGLHPTVVAATN